MATQVNIQQPPDARPNTDVNALVMVILAITLTVSVFVIMYFFKGTFIRDVLMGRYEVEIERVIFQGMTLLMFFMSVSNVILKGRVLKGEMKLIKSNLIPDDINMKDIPSIMPVYEKLLAHKLLPKKVFLARITRVLAMWINTQDFERTSSYAREENEMDLFTSDSTFRANRMYIWAMPLLGFVGTVYGVSYGIGGFADFLRGEVTSDMIKVQVGMITQGLAVAFFCTLLGLLCAGIAAFPGMSCERKEESVLEEIAAYVQNRLMAKMPSVRKTEFPVEMFAAMKESMEGIKLDVPLEQLADSINVAMAEMIMKMEKQEFPVEKMADAITHGMEKMNLQLGKLDFPVQDLSDAITKGMGEMSGKLDNIKVDFPVDKLATAIDEGFRRIPNPDQYAKVFAHAVASASDVVNNKYQEFAQGYEDRIGSLGGRLAEQLVVVADSFRSGMGGVAEKLTVQADQMNQISQRQSVDFANAHQKHLSALTDLDVKEISKWQTLVGDFRQLASQMTDQFKQAVAQMQGASTDYSERIGESAKGLSTQLGNVVQVGVRIEQMLSVSQAMETSLAKLGSSEEFGQTLATLRSHLTASDSLMKSLSKPRTIVLQEEIRA